MNNQAAKYLIGQIRSKYPHPVAMSCRHADEQEYCVGGAIFFYHSGLKEYDELFAFPRASVIQRVIMDLNPQCQYSFKYACEIIKHNDWGKYNEAWGFFEQAITEGEE